jgi:hypothetical protein
MRIPEDNGKKENKKRGRIAKAQGTKGRIHAPLNLVLLFYTNVLFAHTPVNASGMLVTTSAISDNITSRNCRATSACTISTLSYKPEVEQTRIDQEKD